MTRVKNNFQYLKVYLILIDTVRAIDSLPNQWLGLLGWASIVCHIGHSPVIDMWNDSKNSVAEFLSFNEAWTIMNNSFAPPGESSADLYNERTIIDGLFLGAIAYGEFQPVSSRRV